MSKKFKVLVSLMLVVCLLVMCAPISQAENITVVSRITTRQTMLPVYGWWTYSGPTYEYISIPSNYRLYRASSYEVYWLSTPISENRDLITEYVYGP
jgi:hypothetical protein